jgi:hypothetical protein
MATGARVEPALTACMAFGRGRGRGRTEQLTLVRIGRQTTRTGANAVWRTLARHNGVKVFDEGEKQVAKRLKVKSCMFL